MITVALWMCYLLGGFASLWKRANLSASNKHTPWETVGGYLAAHGPESLINILLSTALFWSWWHDPTFMNRAINYIGFTTDHQMPLNPFTAVIYGVFSDNIMDFVIAKGAARFKSNPPQG